MKFSPILALALAAPVAANLRGAADLPTFQNTNQILDVLKDEFVGGGKLSLTWSDCGDADTHGKVTSLTPDKMELGEKTTVTGTGNVDEDISGGTFSIHLSAFMVSETYEGDICEAKTFDMPMGMGTVTWNGMPCPSSAGDISLSTDILLSSSIPSSLAKSTVAISATHTNGDKLVCMEVKTA